MTDITTTPPAPTPEAPPSAEQRLAAHDEYQRLSAKLLDFAAHDVGPEKRALIDRMHEVNKIRFAPEPAAPPAGPSWQDRRLHRETRRALDTELLQHTHEGSPEARQVIEDVLAEQADFDAKRPAPPPPGQYTWDDFNRTASTRDWTGEEKALFRAWGTAVHLSPMRAIQLAGHWPGPSAATQPLINWEDYYGPEYPTKVAHFERALKALGDETYERLRALGLGHQGTEAAVAEIIAIGEELAAMRR